jgi:hypothetical protein
MSSPVGRRRRPRPLVPGKQVPVDSGEVRELLAARADLERVKLQLRRVTARLERALGDAEYGTVDGRIVLWREQAKTGGHYVGINHRDDLRAIADLQAGARPLGTVAR